MTWLKIDHIYCSRTKVLASSRLSLRSLGKTYVYGTEGVEQSTRAGMDWNKTLDWFECIQCVVCFTVSPFVTSGCSFSLPGAGPEGGVVEVVLWRCMHAILTPGIRAGPYARCHYDVSPGHTSVTCESDDVELDLVDLSTSTGKVLLVQVPVRARWY